MDINEYLRGSKNICGNKWDFKTGNTCMYYKITVNYNEAKAMIDIFSKRNKLLTSA